MREGILRAHLEILQDKVNDYLDYIASGQIYEDFGGKGKTPNIKIIFCHKPTGEVEFFLDKIKNTVIDNKYTFEWIYRPV